MRLPICWEVNRKWRRREILLLSFVSVGQTVMASVIPKWCIGDFLQHALLSSRRDVSCCELPIPILKRLTEVNLKDEADWVTFFSLPIQTYIECPELAFEASYNDKYIHLVLKKPWFETRDHYGLMFVGDRVPNRF